jgi:arginase
MRVCCISVPYDMGRFKAGHGQGSMRLRDGVERLLRESGHRVESRTIICKDAEQLTDTQTTFTLNALLSAAIAKIAGSGTFPVVFAGNCMTAAGTLSGLGKENISMVWMDAHADFNTPETTRSGYLDGMSLSVACGRCWRGLSAADPRYRAVKEDHVTLVGTRDLDPEEGRMLSASTMRVVTAGQLRESDCHLPGVAAPPLGDLYVHLDADVLDTSIGHANRFASTGGLLEKETSMLMQWAVSKYNVAALAITAFDPERDPAGSIQTALERIVHATVTALDAKR